MSNLNDDYMNIIEEEGLWMEAFLEGYIDLDDGSDDAFFQLSTLFGDFEEDDLDDAFEQLTILFAVEG